MRGGVNTDAVDLFRSRRSHSHRRRPQDGAVGPLPSWRGQTFGIVEPIRGRSLEEDNGARNDRTGERTPAGFIHTGEPARLNLLPEPELLIEL